MSVLRAVPLLLALLAAPPACSRGGRPAPVQRHAARGEVVRLPARGAPELLVRHEAVPGFLDRDGAVVGMAAMVMPFALGPGASAAGLAAGDKLRFTFAVDWSRGAFWIEELEKLPASTPLDFGPGTYR